jgi:hypothetical protein
MEKKDQWNIGYGSCRLLLLTLQNILAGGEDG